MKKFTMAIMAAMMAALFATSAFAVSVGQPVKGFTLMDMNGRKVSLVDYRGKTVVLNFWATWCPPCRAEMPEFNEMNKEFQKSGKAVLLAINMTDGMRDTKSKVESFLKENKYSMTVLLDDGGKVADSFLIRYIPSTFVIDKDGKLVGKIQGGTSKAAVMKLVDEAK